jgi:hypothetical protein
MEAELVWRLQMRKAEARKEAEGPVEMRYEEMMQELWRLHRSLPLESYFKALDDFVDRARCTISRIPDPDERDRMHAVCSRVVESAINLACNIQS